MLKPLPRDLLLPVELPFYLMVPKVTILKVEFMVPLSFFGPLLILLDDMLERGLRGWTPQSNLLGIMPTERL